MILGQARLHHEESFAIRIVVGFALLVLGILWIRCMVRLTVSTVETEAALRSVSATRREIDAL